MTTAKQYIASQSRLRRCAAFWATFFVLALFALVSIAAAVYLPGLVVAAELFFVVLYFVIKAAVRNARV